MELKFYTDPGHGWIAVKRTLLETLGIADKISPYSYQNGGTAYLEEDCDASVLMQALKANNIPFTLNRIYQERTPIRNYARYLG